MKMARKCVAMQTKTLRTSFQIRYKDTNTTGDSSNACVCSHVSWLSLSL